jgi:hypothetical protein
MKNFKDTENPMLKEIKQNGILHPSSDGQIECMVMPQTPPNKKALLDEQGFGFDSAEASYFSLSSLSKATSMACVLPLIAGEFFFTNASRATSSRSGSLIAIGVRVNDCLAMLHSPTWIVYGNFRQMYNGATFRNFFISSRPGTALAIRDTAEVTADAFNLAWGKLNGYYRLAVSGIDIVFFCYADIKIGGVVEIIASLVTYCDCHDRISYVKLVVSLINAILIYTTYIQYASRAWIVTAETPCEQRLKKYFRKINPMIKRDIRRVYNLRLYNVYTPIYDAV